MGVKASKAGRGNAKNGVKKTNTRKQSELNDDPETVVVRGGSIETISLSQDGRRKSSLSPKLERGGGDKNSISPTYDGARKNSVTPTNKRVRTASDGGGAATASTRRTNSARAGRRPSFNPVVSSHSPAFENGGGGSPAISVGQLTPESALHDSPFGAGGGGGLPAARNSVVNRQQSVGSVSTLCRSRPGSTTSAGRLPRLRYLEHDSRVFVDTLHMKALAVGNTVTTC